MQRPRVQETDLAVPSNSPEGASKRLSLLRPEGGGQTGGFNAGIWVGPIAMAVVVTSLLSIFVSGFFFGLSVLCWLTDSILKRRLVLRFPPFFVGWLIFLGFVLLSIGTSPDPGLSLPYLKKFLKLFSILLIYTYFDWALVERGLRAIFCAIGFSACLGVVQFFWLKDVDLMHRIDGFMSHWMTFSGQLMLCSLALIGYLLYVWGDRRNYSTVLIVSLQATLLLMVSAMVLTYTRGAWIGFCGGLGILLAMVRFRLVIIAGILICAGFFLLPESFHQRIYSSFDPLDTTTRGRIELVKTGVRLIEQNPLTGVGPRLVYKAALENRTEHAIPSTAYQHLHNNLLQIAAEVGIPGLISWLLVWGWIIFDLLRFRRSDSRQLRWFATLSISVITAFQLMGLFEYNFGDSEILILLIFFMTAPYSVQRERLDQAASRDRLA
ncbi:MAG: O-antigen ligase family protein [Acidobacteriota bacterium]|nr:MAG: O-antigen ligase family protein [Acidobacteriota bacterium]